MGKDHYKQCSTETDLPNCFESIVRNPAYTLNDAEPSAGARLFALVTIQ